MPFELGRTLLVRGEVERRAKRKAAAKESLERALVIFDELGAPLWARRTREELQRIGLRRATGDELSEGERRVAELAASGLTNREVAAQLFMSPKTIEANLARVYRKLGIRSRAELGARVAELAREPAKT
jgi:DNA-binding NarL/FixJ family response regulator